MIEVKEKAAFFNQLASERAAAWPLAQGVTFFSRREHQSWGIALHVQRRALRPEQLREALQLRFTQAQRFNQYFMLLDVRGDLVVWHALSAAPSSAYLEDVQQNQLALVGMEQLISK